VTNTPAGTLDSRFAARMGQLLGPDFPDHIALAVSGGGDSMAMLALSHGWARVMGLRLSVVTVDHGLRAGSAAEAAMVAQECAALGHEHATLRWHWDGKGNLQDAARQARLRLIAEWGRAQHVLFAHTRDDLAETFLMRLARGSGVDGLAAMADKRRVGEGEGFWQLRPLLGESRAALRHYVDTLKLPYVDDPSNDDPRFDRVRMRQALEMLEGLGISRNGLADTATRMSDARAVLQAQAAAAARDILRPPSPGSGHILFDRDGFADLHRDTQLRLLGAALQWVSNAAYRPRANPLSALRERALSGGGGVLHGGQVVVGRDLIRVFRELKPVRDEITPIRDQQLWDGLWRVHGTEVERCEIRALGQSGWEQIPEKQASPIPHQAALSLPAVFEGPRLIACKALGFGPDHEMTRCGPAPDFASFLQLR